MHKIVMPSVFITKGTRLIILLHWYCTRVLHGNTINKKNNSSSSKYRCHFTYIYCVYRFFRAVFSHQHLFLHLGMW